MRRLTYPAAVLLLVASATVANAGAGLPKLGTFQAGVYKAAVHIDSQVPHVGTNVITVESAGLPAGAHVELSFISPGGQPVKVPLKPLTVLTGSGGGHGEAAADDHDAPKTDDHSSGYNARGKVKLNQTGHWKAVMVIDGVPEGKVTAEVPFDVEQGGPNRIFLAFSGLLMGGTMIYGAVNRRSNARNGR